MITIVIDQARFTWNEETQELHYYTPANVAVYLGKQCNASAAHTFSRGWLNGYDHGVEVGIGISNIGN